MSTGDKPGDRSKHSERNADADQDDFQAAVVDGEVDQDEFAESDADDVSPDIDEFDDELDEDPAEDIDAVVELSSKEQSARSLEVRRAIEARQEQKRLDEDIDYLDLDFED